jgi:predicted SAM-dependent methyltransferase
VKKLVEAIDGPIKLNIGCGTDYKDGWINIDNNSDNNIEKLDLNWDLRFPLPFEDNTVDFIFNEHFFEHLSPEDGVRVMADLRRVLKPSGILRIAMPDLEVVVNNYLNVPLNKDPVIKAFGFDYIQTPAEWINMSFRFWGHEWLYDWEELERRLRQAGFTNIKRVTLRKSKHEELKNLEIRDGSYLVAEVVNQD